jgi:hypothetical protein
MNKIILLILIFYFSFSGSFSQSVSGLKAIFKNGQTFLTWNNISELNKVTYYVYRSDQPFKSISDFSKDNFLAKVNDSSTYNFRLSEIIKKPVFFKIDDIGIPLDVNKSLYVQTAIENGKFYYAVIPTVNDNKIIEINQGENILNKPVKEKVEQVFPVYQMSLDTIGSRQNIYTHWISKFGNKLYPAMTTTYNYYYNFSVIRENNTSENPLLIYLHARWYNFLTNEKGTDYPNELILSLDDHLPNEIVNTFWYGYHNNFNFYNPDTIPKEGTVTDYTIRRIKWTINWVKNNFPVDTNRLYFCGGSMGGSGSILAGLSMYDKIAAIYTINPKFDYSFLYDPNPESLYNTGKLRRTLISRLWGSTDINLPTSEDIPVYSKLNAGFMLKSIKKKSIPFIIAFNGKNDNIVGWAEKIPYYKAVESSKHGGYYFWDQRTHNLNSLKNLGSLQNPEIIHKFALNKSYPAFSKCTINNEPGNGISTNGDPVGTINGYLSWKDSIIDEENYYEILIYPVNLIAENDSLYFHDSIFVNITLRRLQNLPANYDHSYYFQNIDNEGNILQDGYFKTDMDDLLTVENFLVTKNGNKLIIVPFKTKEYDIR